MSTPVVLLFAGRLTCPNEWNPTNNGSCWRAFDKVQMSWPIARAFCQQQDSRLAKLADFKVINRTVSDSRRYWVNDDTHIKSYISRDPLQGWYWLDGGQFNASHRRGLYGELSYTAEKDRCAVIRDSKNGIWEDSPCHKSRSFICKSVIDSMVFIVHIYFSLLIVCHYVLYKKKSAERYGLT